jgi:DNA-binding MarR family transcriptional regulator
MNADDHVARVARMWARERPDLDPAPLLIVGRIMRLAAAYDTLLRPPFAAAGVGSGDFDLLAALRRAGSPYALTPSELAAAMLVTTGAATKRIDRLERQGLVRRDPASTDGRSRTVTLTPAGRQLVDELMPRHLANENGLLEALSPRQREQLERLLAVLAATVETADATESRS